MKQYKPLAAIDIGTNSIHLIIVDVEISTGRYRVLDREKEMVRLGNSSTDMKYLSASAMNRGIDTLKRFKILANAAGAPVRAVATSAVREALNQDEFIRRAHSEAGIRVEIVSGLEEARLIYLGVLQALPVFSNQILMIDIGGGSTEFLIGKERKILYDNSLKVGAIRLTRKFLASQKLTMKAVNQCREYIVGLMNPVSRILKKMEYEVAVGTSGTIVNLANMIRRARGENSSARLNNFSFTKDELFEVIENIVAARDVKERSTLDGLDLGRADIIVAGSLILEQIFKELKIKHMVVSEYALREGIVYDTIEKKREHPVMHRLDDIRLSSVLHLAESVGDEQEHSRHVANLALRIFDQTKDMHRLGNREREYLEAAAILHEVGLFVSHTEHHHHSYYLIRNAELLGFTENEKEIIANIARYHRKSHPKRKHPGFQNLSLSDQRVVTKLASILRIADGLDRTHSSLISDVLCKKYAKTITFKLKRRHQTLGKLEVWGANLKKELFENTFHRTVKLKFS